MRELKFNLDGVYLPRIEPSIKVSEIPPIVDFQLYNHIACPEEYALKFSLLNGQDSPTQQMRDSHRAENTSSHGNIVRETYEEYLNKDGSFCCFYKNIPFFGTQSGDLECCNLEEGRIVEHTTTQRKEIEPWLPIPEKIIQSFSYAFFLSRLNAGDKWNIELNIAGQTRTTVSLVYTSAYRYLVASWLEEVVKVNTGELQIPIRKPGTMRECRTCEVQKECQRLWKLKKDNSSY